MATYAEVEDLRDWCIKTIAEYLGRIDRLNGGEPAHLMKKINDETACIGGHAQTVIGLLDRLLVEKKRAEEPPPL